MLASFRAALAAFALFALLSTPSSALDLPSGVTAGPSVEGITEYRLDNGLRVLLFPDASKPTVTVNITYLVGSRHENYGETGMAHLLEHLLFKGTPTHSDIPGEMKKRGVGFNASTWLDRTNYFGSFTADDETLRWMLELEADRMVNSFVARKDLDSEMTVVRNEMESGENNPVRVLIDRVTSTAHLWHNYGNSTIGARADIENLPIERLQAFYRAHYRPDNATLLVAGRIEPARALTEIVATFGKIAKPSVPMEVTYTREPTQDGEREVTVRRVGETAYAALAYHGPAAAHADFAALDVLLSALGDTPTGRLHKALVENKLATFVAGFGFALAEPGYMMFLAEVPKESSVDGLRPRLIKLIEANVDAPFTEEEVTDTKRRLLKDIELTMNDANRLAMSLSEAIAQGDWRMFFLQRDRIEAVSAADVNRVAQHYLKPSNRTFGQFIPTAAPDRTEISEAPAVASLVEGYVGRAAMAAGEVFEPSPANIDARTEWTTLGDAGNETKLVLLPKKTRGNTVLLAMNLRFGGAEDVQGQSRAAEFAAAMLTRGSEKYSREAISRRLDELKAQLSISGSTQGLSVSANTTREHLPELLALIEELLKHSTFPASEFEQLRTQAITDVESSRTEPTAIAGLELDRYGNTWPKGHPKYVESFDEQLESLTSVTLEQARQFSADFHAARSGEITLIGDFDAAAIKSDLRARFGDWTATKPFVRIADPYRELAAVSRRFETPDKANALLLMAVGLPMADSHPDYPALIAGNYVFGGGSLKSRLADRVRQKDGLSYSVASQFSADAIDAAGGHLMYAIAAPENMVRVEAAFREELALLLKEGVSAVELKDAIDGLLKARERSRGEDASLLASLSNNAYLNRTMAWSADLEARLAALTPEVVNAALRKHLNPENYSVFSAGDFAGVAAKQAAVEKAGETAAD
ncbi:MAG: M16 family metallopeptidase [Pseudomarimonas sp.]